MPSIPKTAVIAIASLCSAGSARAADLAAICGASGCGADHALLQLAEHRRLSRSDGAGGDQAACETSEPEEQCYAAVDWAMEHGIRQHPEWYPNLTLSSTFEQFQALMSERDPEDCKRPCNLCHTAVPGEACHGAVTWAMEHGIRNHPEWYIGLTYGASFEEFQAHLHLGGKVVDGSPHGGCPMPCNLCRTVTEETETCYTDLAWAMEHGITLHPEWYPGLTAESSQQEFQGFLNTQHVCPLPCGQCHTAVDGERCYNGVMWAKDHGIKKHPEWYPDLSEDSTFEAFQLHLHEAKYEQCPRPCE